MARDPNATGAGFLARPPQTPRQNRAGDYVEEAPMNDAAETLTTLLELDARHDELLRRLDELDQQIERVLKDCRAEWKPQSAPDD